MGGLKNCPCIAQIVVSCRSQKGVNSRTQIFPHAFPLFFPRKPLNINIGIPAATLSYPETSQNPAKICMYISKAARPMVRSSVLEARTSLDWRGLTAGRFEPVRTNRPRLPKTKRPTLLPGSLTKVRTYILPHEEHLS